MIGRGKEYKQIQAAVKDNKAHFIAVYGRRRVGKTYLIRAAANHHPHYCEITGIKEGNAKTQLLLFYQAIEQHLGIPTPNDLSGGWLQALNYLDEQLQQITQPIVLFFDELPWLAKPRSGLLQALDYTWNTKWSMRANITLIVCGSAASWMLDKLINAKGGLHNRLTQTMLIEPFDLKTTEKFLLDKQIKWRQKQILDIYMVMGGIPYYLDKLDRSESVVQNIQRICFSKTGLLLTEFERVFASLFEAAEETKQIINAIASKRHGISRDSLTKLLKLSSGGHLNKRLQELSAAGFIQKFIPYGKKNRGIYYKVIDEYSLFYLHWIYPMQQQGFSFTEGYWQTKANTPAYHAWSGYAFEAVCLKHIEPIRRALNLQHTGCVIGSWQSSDTKQAGAQIDLLIDRDDETITLCEIKHNKNPFTIDKAYAKNLMNKLLQFEQQTKTHKQIILAMITSGGINDNAWSKDLIDASIKLDALFG